MAISTSLTSGFLFLVSILLMAQSGKSLKCYSCLGTSDENSTADKISTLINLPQTFCPAAVNDYPSVICSSTDVCIKFNVETLGILTTYRMCGPKSFCPDADNATEAGCNCCTCNDEDLCNGAAIMPMTAIFILPALFWSFW